MHTNIEKLSLYTNVHDEDDDDDDDDDDNENEDANLMAAHRSGR